LDEWLEKLDSDEWLAVYRARLSLLNRPITLKQEHGFLHGVALDVAQDGALLVQNDSGQIQPCYAGEVTSQG
jgi:biotin-(acetyl-CoA carboxylase) ligase